MVRLEDVKNSLRIDHDLDDDLITQLIYTASSYIKSAIDSEALDGEIEVYKQFEWSVSLLAQHWYLNRQESTSERMPTTVQALIQQMRGVYYATH